MLRNSEQRLAWETVWAAVEQGSLPHPSETLCQECGETAEVHHHPSYAPEDHLKTTTLCRPCHSRLHRRGGKSNRKRPFPLRAGEWVFLGTLTADQVAERLGFHPSTVANMIKSGTLTAFKRGRKWLIPRSVVAGYQLRALEAS